MFQNAWFDILIGGGLYTDEVRYHHALVIASTSPEHRIFYRKFRRWLWCMQFLTLFCNIRYTFVAILSHYQQNQLMAYISPSFAYIHDHVVGGVGYYTVALLQWMLNGLFHLNYYRIHQPNKTALTWIHLNEIVHTNRAQFYAQNPDLKLHDFSWTEFRKAPLGHLAEIKRKLSMIWNYDTSDEVKNNNMRKKYRLEFYDNLNVMTRARFLIVVRLFEIVQALIFTGVALLIIPMTILMQYETIFSQPNCTLYRFVLITAENLLALYVALRGVKIIILFLFVAISFVYLYYNLLSQLNKFIASVHEYAHLYNRFAGLILSKQCAHYREEHSKLLCFILKLNQSVGSKSLVIIFGSLLPFQVYLISYLLINPSDHLHWLYKLFYYLILIYLNCSFVLAFKMLALVSGQLHASAKYLPRIQFYLSYHTNKNKNKKKYRNNNFETIWKVLKLESYYTRINTKGRQFGITLGQFGVVTNKAIFEGTLLYIGFIMIMFQFLKNH